MPTDFQLAKNSTRENLLQLNARRDGRWVMEPKIDGFRVGIRKEGRSVSIYSRSHKSQAGKVLHIEYAVAAAPRDFVIDGEMVALGSLVKTDQGLLPLGDFNRTGRVMGSGAHKAQLKQTLSDALVFLAFDIVSLNGQPVADYPEHSRRAFLEDVLAEINSPYIAALPRLQPSAYTYDQYCEAGGEGMMIKDTTATYSGTRSAGWLKVKAESTEDCVITGFTEGKGKFADTIGAIVFSQYRDGVLVERGQCSGMDDATRYKIGANRSAYLGKVIEVKHNTVATTAKLEGLRHPQFLRFRTDKNPTDCTF